MLRTRQYPTQSANTSPETALTKTKPSENTTNNQVRFDIFHYYKHVQQDIENLRKEKAKHKAEEVVTSGSSPQVTMINPQTMQPIKEGETVQGGFFAPPLPPKRDQHELFRPRTINIKDTRQTTPPKRPRVASHSASRHASSSNTHIHSPRKEYADYRCTLCKQIGHIQWNCLGYECRYCQRKGAGHKPEHCPQTRCPGCCLFEYKHEENCPNGRPFRLRGGTQPPPQQQQ